MFGLGLPELMVVLVIVMVLFGARRLPELASGMGKAIRNFKKESGRPDEIEVTPGAGSLSDKSIAKEEKGETAIAGKVP